MIHQHICPICGTSLDAADEIARLRARIATLEAANDTAPTPTPAKARTHPRAVQRAASEPDYRSAADVWLAGDVLHRPKKAEYRKGVSKPVVVTFADGEIMRVSTYLDGQAGLNSAAQHARTVKQARPPAMIEILRARTRGIDLDAGKWVRDSRGCWRLVQVTDCAPVLMAEYAADDSMLLAAE